MNLYSPRLFILITAVLLCYWLRPSVVTSVTPLALPIKPKPSPIQGPTLTLLPPAKLPFVKPVAAKASPKKPAFDFSGTPLDERDFELALNGDELPQEIVFLDRDEEVRLKPNAAASGKRVGERALVVSTLEFARETARTREREAARRPAQWPKDDREGDQAGAPLAGGDYEFLSYFPGTDKHGLRIRQDKDLSFAVRGPDFSLEMVDTADREKLKEIRRHVVSLGNTGAVVLKIDGFITDEAGLDFYIFENVFRLFARPNEFFNEFGRIGVSESGRDDDYTWFPCAPTGAVKTCAGVVPTSEGGDGFDLGAIGVRRARFIKIQDTGTNFNTYSEKGDFTEGFDLDAIRIVHGYQDN